MSYLDAVRLTFHGDYQADVSTVNNDVRHYALDSFEDRFQAPSQGDVMNGWWNPTGSNAFRLLNCRVGSVGWPDGRTVSDPAQDPACALAIGGPNTAVSAKLVDLDPQWQMSSQIWGLELRLVDASGVTLMRGAFEATAFRDILFGRQADSQINGQGASAMFVSVLTGVTWGADESIARSPCLTALRAASAPGMLSIRLTTFGYFTRADHQRFTLGTVVGAIGPWRPSEPRSFVAGRRFAPVRNGRTREGVTFFDGRLDTTRRMAVVDLSNTLPLTDPFGALADIGQIDLVALHDDRLAEGVPAAAGQYTVMSRDIPYRQAGWLAATGGVHGTTLAADVAAAAAQQPWALVAHRSAAPTILIRETSGGLHIRVDQFVQRIDTPGTVRTTAWVTKYGAPLPDTAVALAWIGRIQGTGGGPDDDPQAPRAPLPDINVPSDVLSFGRSTRTGADGRAELQIDVAAIGDVRGYLDGQIYALGYGLQDAPNVARHRFDLVILHARSAYAPPALPSWTRDAQPVFAQFGNLYPVMSRRLIDLNKYEDVVQSRAVLALSLALPIEDPNHMPVTRDLSGNKRQMLLAWLNERDANGFVLRRDPPAAAPGLPVAAAPIEGLESAHPADARNADEAFTRTLIALQLRKGRGDSGPDR